MLYWDNHQCSLVKCMPHYQLTPTYCQSCGCTVELNSMALVMDLYTKIHLCMWLIWLWMRLLLNTLDCTPVLCFWTMTDSNLQLKETSLYHVSDMIIIIATYCESIMYIQFLILMFTLEYLMFTWEYPHNPYWVPVLIWAALLHCVLISTTASSPFSTSGPIIV